jgi:hypothetical protein
MSVFIATAKAGKLDWGSGFNESRLSQELNDNEGKSYRLQKMVHKRSDNQNRLYWAYLGIISHDTGDDANSLHEYFKRAFLPPKFITARKKEIKIPSSTTDLNKSDFSEYMMRIEVETGIPVPSWEALEAAGYIKN